MEKPGERPQSRFRYVVLDALCVDFSGLGGKPQGNEEIDDKTVAGAYPPGQSLALFGQEHAAIRTCGRELLALETGNGIDCRRMRHPKTSSDIGGARLPGCSQQIGDKLHVIFQ